MTTRQRDIIRTSARVATAVRREAELNGEQPYEVPASRVRQLVQEVASSMALPEYPWRRFERDVLAQVADSLGARY